MDGEFYIRPATDDDIQAVKNLVFTVLKEYLLNPDETGKDKDLSHLTKHYFENNGFFGFKKIAPAEINERVDQAYELYL